MLPTVHVNRNQNPRTPSALRDARPGSRSRWFDDKGELCASDRKDAIKSIASLMTAKSNGQVVMTDPEMELSADQLRQRREDCIAAYHDRSTNAWQETGSSISAILYETAKREGFLRRFLLQGDLDQGNVPRIAVRFQNVQAIVATDAFVYLPQIVKQRYIWPPEIYVLGNHRVTERDIAQGPSDIMEDTYNRGLEQINVKEDRILVGALNQAVGITNPLYLLAGGATPSNVAAMRTALLQYGLQAEQWLISADFWTDIAGNAAAWGNLFDPVTRYELVQTGFLGTILGMDVTTDGFRDPMQQVVAPNDCYVLTAPVNLGAYTDRGPVKAVAQDQYADGIPGRGWYFSGLISACLTNARGVVRGRRV